MNAIDIPFHKMLNIKDAAKPFIFSMDEAAFMLNHVGSIHACIQLTLAEASAGEFLKQELPAYQDTLIPLVRKTEATYAKPANGKLFTQATFFDCTKTETIYLIESKSRFMVKTKVIVTNEKKEITLKAIFEWFVIKKNV